MLEQAVDYTNSLTKSFANLLASKSEGSYNLGQICEIYSYLRKKWKYVNDPVDNEYVAYASESIQDCNLSGDCDDFAVLMYVLKKVWTDIDPSIVEKAKEKLSKWFDQEEIDEIKDMFKEQEGW